MGNTIIFQHTFEAVESGRKTQTRRNEKPGDRIEYAYRNSATERDVKYIAAVYNANGRLRWKVGGIHPEKKTNPYAPDLLLGEGQLADLKTQIKPFFTSARYGIDPTYAVSFNEKDYLRYNQRYPGLVIFWWIVREPEYGYGQYTKRINGVWRVGMGEITHRIRKGIVPLHEYRNRVNDQQGNGKASYIFDLRTFKELWRVV